jgi:hypothetical protein
MKGYRKNIRTFYTGRTQLYAGGENQLSWPILFGKPPNFGGFFCAYSRKKADLGA